MTEYDTVFFLTALVGLGLPLVIILSPTQVDIYTQVFGAGIFAVPSGMCFGISWLIPQSNWRN